MSVVSINVNSYGIVDTLAEDLIARINNDKIVIVCIGTDRSAGDCLGPYLGTLLSESSIKDKVKIFGTLDTPIMATNLAETKELIDKEYPNHLVIAIDSALGDYENIGHIRIKDGPLSPGEGLGKNLPNIGDISIKCVINISGTLEFMVLQNTRFNIVHKLAHTTSEIIEKAINAKLLPKPQHNDSTDALAYSAYALKMMSSDINLYGSEPFKREYLGLWDESEGAVFEQKRLEYEKTIKYSETKIIENLIKESLYNPLIKAVMNNIIYKYSSGKLDGIGAIAILNNNFNEFIYELIVAAFRQITNIEKAYKNTVLMSNSPIVITEAALELIKGLKEAEGEK